MISIVITSIREGGSLPAWQTLCTERGYEFIVVRDVHGPQTGLSFEAQERRWPRLSQLVGTHTYSRKIFGYLAARGQIYETDDDNYPVKSWMPPTLETDNAVTGRFFNPLGSKRLVARGWPMSQDPWNLICHKEHVQAFVSQHFCSGMPDCYAFERVRNCEVGNHAPIIGCPPGCWTPFNSQMTLWRQRNVAMYIPVTCPGRQGDILRGWLAQAYHRDQGVIHADTGVHQTRNAHNFERDLREECKMLHDTTELLERLGPDDEANVNLLIELGWCDPSEMAIYKEWKCCIQS